MTMERKKKIRVLRYCIVGLVLLTVVLLAVSVYTLIYGLTGAISGSGFGLKLDTNGPNGDWILRFDGSPRNPGFLSTRLFIHIGVLDPAGQYIVSNSSSVDIPPGGQSRFSVVLTIPLAAVQKYSLNQTQGAQATFELIFGIRTLGDLVGFTQTLRIQGSPQ